MTDFRALCEELLAHAKKAQKIAAQDLWFGDEDDGLFGRADTALAAPELQPVAEESSVAEPAAQAIEEAVDNAWSNSRARAAAALRAVADQVVPPEQERLFNEERPWDGELCAVVEIRQQLIAIANELEAQP